MSDSVNYHQVVLELYFMIASVVGENNVHGRGIQYYYNDVEASV